MSLPGGEYLPRYVAAGSPGGDWEVFDTEALPQAVVVSRWPHVWYGFEAREQAEIDADIRNQREEPQQI